MIKALLLIFEPAATWDKIIQARRGMAFLLFAYLLPMLIIPSIAEAYGLVRWGEWQAFIETKKYFKPREAVIFEVAQLLLWLVVVYISTRIIKAMGDTFHSRHSFGQAFTTVVYGLSPVFLLRVLDTFSISPWAPWAVGMLLTIHILYHGVPKVMEPDPSHAFGLYLTSWMLLGLTTGILRFATWAFLAGRFPGLQKLMESVA